MSEPGVLQPRNVNLEALLDVVAVSPEQIFEFDVDRIGYRRSALTLSTASRFCGSLRPGTPGFPEQRRQAPLLQGNLHARVMQIPVRLPQVALQLTAQRLLLARLFLELLHGLVRTPKIFLLRMQSFLFGPYLLRALHSDHDFINPSLELPEHGLLLGLKGVRSNAGDALQCVQVFHTV